MTPERRRQLEFDLWLAQPLSREMIEAAFLALEKEVREECAKVCDLAARQYRQMKTSFIIEHGLYDDKEPDPDEAGDAECEELAYCCELNAKAIRAIGEDK